MKPDTYSTPEAARIIGVPFRSLDELVRRNLFSPTGEADGSGTARKWTMTDILAARCGFEWRQRGAEFGAVAKMMAEIREKTPDEIRRRPIVMLSGGVVSWFRESDKIKVPDDNHGFLANLRPGLEFLERMAEEVKADRANRPKPGRKRRVTIAN